MIKPEPQTEMHTEQECNKFLKIKIIRDEDATKWKNFPRYWPFVRETTGQRWNPLTKTVNAELYILFDLRLTKRLSKQSRRRLFETQSSSL